MLKHVDHFIITVFLNKRKYLIGPFHKLKIKSNMEIKEDEKNILISIYNGCDTVRIPKENVLYIHSEVVFKNYTPMPKVKPPKKKDEK